MHRFNKIGYLMVFLIPTIFFTTYYLSHWAYLYTLPFILFVLFPLLDPIVGVFKGNPSKEEIAAHKDEFYYKAITIAWVIVQTLMLCWLFWIFTFDSISTEQFIPILINTFLMTGGVGITVAHELGHKTTKTERFCSKWLLVQVFYGHFYIEHNRGHHIHVATPADPATSHFNQSLYAFWMQTVFGSVKSAIQLEKELLASKKKKNNVWNNEVYRLSIFSLLFFFICFGLSSFFSQNLRWDYLIFLFAQAFFAFSLLEAINYIEHYGIERKPLGDGKFEPVNPTHSWNANFMLSNWLLFHLQRHSDHHLYSSKRYQVLKQYDESPQLPNGYPAMLILSLFPALWFRSINPRLLKWKNGL